MKYESLSEESECSSAIPSAGGELASESLRFRAEEVLPTVYDGNANYIFVSYAHRDSDVVMPVLAYLIRRGYNVWYDEGITPGRDWDEFLDNKIKGELLFSLFYQWSLIGLTRMFERDIASTKVRHCIFECFS